MKKNINSQSKPITKQSKIVYCYNKLSGFFDKDPELSILISMIVSSILSGIIACFLSYNIISIDPSDICGRQTVNFIIFVMLLIGLTGVIYVSFLGVHKKFGYEYDSELNEWVKKESQVKETVQ